MTIIDTTKKEKIGKLYRIRDVGQAKRWLGLDNTTPFYQIMLEPGEIIMYLGSSSITGSAYYDPETFAPKVQLTAYHKVLYKEQLLFISDKAVNLDNEVLSDEYSC